MEVASRHHSDSCNFRVARRFLEHMSTPATKGKAVPLQALDGPQGSRKLRFPDFVTMAQDGGKVVSLTHRPPLPPRKYSRYSFLLEADSTPGFYAK